MAASRRTSYGFTLRIESHSDLRRVARVLGEIDKELPGKLDKILYEAAKRGAAKASAKILRAPTGNSPRHTRARIARGVGVRRSRRGGYRVTTKMPAGEEILPRGFASQWVHFVFGPPVQVVQQVHFDWFIGPIGDEKDNVIRDIRAELQAAADKVDHET